MQESSLPYSPPDILSFLPGSIKVEYAISIIFTLLFIWWAIYSIIAVYHWFRFGRSSWVAVPVLALHFFVSALIFLFIISGLQ